MINELPQRIAKRYPQSNSISLVYSDSSLLFNFHMNIKQIRHQHFMAALEERFGGSLERMAAETNSNPKYLSQLKNGSRQIGDRTAARLESALGLSSGSWDQPLSYVSPHWETDSPEVRELLQLYEAADPAEQELFLKMARGALRGTGAERSEKKR